MMDSPQFDKVNTTWLEALDAGTGRYYFVNSTSNETTWEPPECFSDRKELVQLIKDARTKTSGMPGQQTEEEFIAKVKARFPPPAGPAPANSSSAEVSTLKERLSVMDQDLNSTRHQAEQLQSERDQQVAAAAAGAAELSAVRGQLEQLTQETTRLQQAAEARGLSSFPLREEPPPVPAWALGKEQ